MLLETAPFGLADSRSAGDRRLSVRFRTFCAHLMVRKLWDLSEVPLNTNMPEVPEVWAALNATLIHLFRATPCIAVKSEVHVHSSRCVSQLSPGTRGQTVTKRAQMWQVSPGGGRKRNLGGLC